MRRLNFDQNPCHPFFCHILPQKRGEIGASLTVWKSHLSTNSPQDDEEEQEFWQSSHLNSPPPSPQWEKSFICPSSMLQRHLLKSPLWGFRPHGTSCGSHGGFFRSHGSPSQPQFLTRDHTALDHCCRRALIATVISKSALTIGNFL